MERKMQSRQKVRIRFAASRLFVHFPLINGIRYSGMTAIAAVCTPEGFVLGADGRETSINGTVRTDKKQKIFSANAKDLRAAYGFAGYVTVHSFDFVLQAQDVERELQFEAFHSLVDYAVKFSTVLYYRLIEHTAGVDLSSFPESNLVCFLMAGYAKNTAEITSIGFYLVNGVLQKPRLKCAFERSSAHFTTIGGYDEVYRAMCHQGLMKPPKTLREGAELIDKYITTCSDRCNAAIVGDERFGIGGHIHIAAVTASKSWWVICP
jgi:hypothetical protein